MLVEQYSTRQLSFGSDKLPALSGLASCFHCITKCTYDAGLLEEDLASGLLWYLKADQDPFVGSAEARAPTWSWASVDGDMTRYV